MERLDRVEEISEAHSGMPWPVSMRRREEPDPIM